MNYGHDIEILIGNKAWHYYGETGRGLWSPWDLWRMTCSYQTWYLPLHPSFKDFHPNSLIKFPWELKTIILVSATTISPCTQNYYFLSVQSWRRRSPANLHRRSSRPSTPTSRPFSSLFSWRKRQKTIRTFVRERPGANWRHYLSLLLRHLYFISDQSWPSPSNIKYLAPHSSHNKVLVLIFSW